MSADHIAPEGHPVHTLMEEHNSLLDFAKQLVAAAEKIGKAKTPAEAISLSEFNAILGYFRESQLHYLREENVLFPYLEKHGVTGPPKQMWTEHDQIRALEKEIYSLSEKINCSGQASAGTDLQQLIQKTDALHSTLEMHYHKENNILFPMSMNAFTAQEWEEVTAEFAKIGYCTFSHASAGKTETKKAEGPAHPDGKIDFSSGVLSYNEIISMMNTMPVEVTFVDKDDTFRYFNQTKDPIFPRSTASIGRKVQNCHPQKSVHMVNQILDDFKTGRKDEHSFWIPMGEKLVYIRYFAVRDQEGNYLGSMEIVQDIKNIQQIKGQKRLLDE